MLNTLTQVQAQRIVHEHGHTTMINAKGVLMGGIECSVQNAKGEYVSAGLDWSPVPLNERDLRFWLGY